MDLEKCCDSQEGILYLTPAWFSRHPQLHQIKIKVPPTSAGSSTNSATPKEGKSDMAIFPTLLDRCLRSQYYTPVLINMEHVLMEVWFRSFSFLFRGDGCRFQPLIFQGVWCLAIFFLRFSWEAISIPYQLLTGITATLHELWWKTWRRNFRNQLCVSASEEEIMKWKGLWKLKQLFAWRFSCFVIANFYNSFKRTVDIPVETEWIHNTSHTRG